MPPTRAAQPYPLWERVLDLFLDPARLFENLRKNPRLDALALSTVAGAFLTSISFAAVRASGAPRPEGAWVPASDGAPLPGDLPGWVLLPMLLLSAPALWGYVFLLAVVGGALGGATGSHLPFRQWLSLSAHCSLVSIAIVPLQVAISLVSGTPGVQLSLAELGASPAHPPDAFEILLARVSLRSLACIALFTAGACVYTRARPWKAGAFIFLAWSGLWFIVGWFTSPRA